MLDFQHNADNKMVSRLKHENKLAEFEFWSSLLHSLLYKYPWEEHESISLPTMG